MHMNIYIHLYIHTRIHTYIHPGIVIDKRFLGPYEPSVASSAYIHTHIHTLLHTHVSLESKKGKKTTIGASRNENE